MASPLVSAIIPAYNRPQQTQRAINSVSEQTYQPIELIIVDDSSQPPLQEELSLPESAVDRIVFKRHEKNKGGNVARNTGIENATGEYLAFLDSDDEWAPEKIRRQVNRLEQSKAGVSYTSVKQVDENGNLNGISNTNRSGTLLNELLRGNAIGTFSSIIIKAKVVDQVGKPDPDMPCWQDWEWYLRLAAKGVKFDAVEEPLTTRYNEGEQISRSYAPKRDEAYPVIREQIERLASTQEQKQIAIAYLDFELGYAALVNQHYSEARRLFRNAIQGYPKDKRFFVYLACTGPHFSLVRHIKRAMVRVIK